jgi:hypothetical protein
MGYNNCPFFRYLFRLRFFWVPGGGSLHRWEAQRTRLHENVVLTAGSLTAQLPIVLVNTPDQVMSVVDSESVSHFTVFHQTLFISGQAKLLNLIQLLLILHVSVPWSLENMLSNYHASLMCKALVSSSHARLNIFLFEECRSLHGAAIAGRVIPIFKVRDLARNVIALVWVLLQTHWLGRIELVLRSVRFLIEKCLPLTRIVPLEIANRHLIFAQVSSAFRLKRVPSYEKLPFCVFIRLVASRPLHNINVFFICLNSTAQFRVLWMWTRRLRWLFIVVVADSVLDFLGRIITFLSYDFVLLTGFCTPVRRNIRQIFRS